MKKQVRGMLDRLLKEAKREAPVYPDTPDGNAQYNTDIQLLLELLPSLVLLRDCWRTHMPSNLSQSTEVYFKEKFSCGREEMLRREAFEEFSLIGGQYV